MDIFPTSGTAGPVTSYAFQVQPQEVDFQFRVTMAALANILLTAAGYNADENGFGMRKLNAMNSSWVLLRLAVEMNYYPEQYEQLHVETWIEDVGHSCTSRNFCIRNAANDIIGNGSSDWAMIDMQTRRPQDLHTLDGVLEFATGKPSLIQHPARIEPVDGPVIDSFKVKYSDIDINNHVNSVRYIEWVSDCFSLDVYREKQIKRFEINYMNELLFGDTVEIAGHEPNSDDYRFEIRKAGKVTCRAKVRF